MKSILLVLCIIVSAGHCQNSYDLLEFVFGPKLGRSHQTEKSTTTGGVSGDTRTAERIVRSFGYRMDTHQVASQTGHILTLHRIPRGTKRDEGDKFPKPVVLIHHGLEASTDVWILRGPKHDLPYMLVDGGYDVWFLNVRGNFYSRKHKTLDPNKDAKYWDFSIEETGYYDLPVAIDYILNITNQQDMFFVGHSLGVTSGLIMCSMKPQYNQKIRLMMGLGPLAVIKHTLNPIHRFVYTLTSNILPVLISENIYEVMPRRDYISKTLRNFCKDKARSQELCVAIMFTIIGMDYEQLNTTTLPQFMKHFPAGTSARILQNVMQYYLTEKSRKLTKITGTGYRWKYLICRIRFAHFDYGSKMLNVLHYNKTVPPLYDLSKVTAPISLHYGPGDMLVTKEDVDQMALELPNVVGIYPVPWKYFNHLDFILAINCRKLVNEPLMNLMDKFR